MNSCRRAHGRAAWRAVCSHPDIVRRKCVPVRGLLVRRLKNNQLLADGYCVTGHEDGRRGTCGSRGLRDGGGLGREP